MQYLKPEQMVILSVRAELRRAYKELAQVQADARGAESSWIAAKEYAGFTKDNETLMYSEAEHKRIKASYQMSIEGAEMQVALWEQALDKALTLA